MSAAQLLEASQKAVPFAVSSALDVENKKRLAEAPKRKSHVRSAAAAGDIQEVLSYLETIQDPQEAIDLALAAHKYLTRYRHDDAVRLLEQECDGIAWHQHAGQHPVRSTTAEGRTSTATSTTAGEGRQNSTVPTELTVKYDPHTAQIRTGKVGSLRLHIDRGIDLPIRDGTTASSDPFVRVILWEGKCGQGRRVVDVSSQIKLMTLNPIFDENFVIDVDDPSCELELTAYDWDEDGTHDFMGKVVVPLREFIEDLIQQRNDAYTRNLEAAKIVSQTAGSKNVVGRSLGGVAGKGIDDIYGGVTQYGVVGWDNATGIKALAAGVQRSSDLPELRPKLYREFLKGIGGGEDSAEGGQLIFTTTFVPAARTRSVANIHMFPRKTLEHITPMTPADQLVFRDKEFLHSSLAEDASWAKSRTLTDDVMWPKDTVVSSFDATSTSRKSIVHLGWRNLIEPTRPYKKPLPAGVSKTPKTGLEEIEEASMVTRREDQDIAMRLADRLWGKQATKKVSLKERMQRAANKALDARAYRTRSDSDREIQRGKVHFEDYKYKEAVPIFEGAMKIAADGGDREMQSVSHKWLGDCWRMLGDFRKARHHHTKHLELDSPAVFDLSGTEGTRDEQQVKALCRQEDVRGSAASYVLDKIRQTPELGGGAEPGAGLQVKPADLAAVVQEARSYHNNQYWISRARVRLDRVDWSEGAARLTMDLVKDAMHDIKKERAGERKPVYVKPSMWGERSHGT